MPRRALARAAAPAEAPVRGSGAPRSTQSIRVSICAFGRNDGRPDVAAELPAGLGVEQQVALHFFCFGRVAGVAVFDQDRPHLFLEEGVVGGADRWFGRVGRSAGRAENHGEENEPAAWGFQETEHPQKYC